MEELLYEITPVPLPKFIQGSKLSGHVPFSSYVYSVFGTSGYDVIKGAIDLIYLFKYG